MESVYTDSWSLFCNRRETLKVLKARCLIIIKRLSGSREWSVHGKRLGSRKRAVGMAWLRMVAMEKGDETKFGR